MFAVYLRVLQMCLMCFACDCVINKNLSCTHPLSVTVGFLTAKHVSNTFRIFGMGDAAETMDYLAKKRSSTHGITDFRYRLDANCHLTALTVVNAQCRIAFETCANNWNIDTSHGSIYGMQYSLITCVSPAHKIVPICFAVLRGNTTDAVLDSIIDTIDMHRISPQEHPDAGMSDEGVECYSPMVSLFPSKSPTVPEMYHVPN
jgi:hypothetical protein